MATCKAWSKQFQPFIWVNLQIGKTLPGRTLLEQNVHRIRNVDLDLQLIRFDGTFGTNLFNFWATLSRGLPVPSTACSSGTLTDRDSQQATVARVAVCTNLRRLKAVLYRSLSEPQNFFWIHYAPLLHNNSNTLTHLQLAFNGTPPPPMMQAISILCRLQNLTLRGPMQKTSWFLSLLRACLPLPRLSEFYCYFAIESGGYTFEVDPEGDFEDGSGDEYDVETAKVIAEPRGELKVILEEAIAARTSKNGIMDVKIRALKLPGLLEGNMIRIINGVIEFQHSAFVFHNPMRGDITSVILPILRSELVEIETLEVPGLVYFRSEKFYEALARKYCSGLRHLILPPCHCSDHPATVCSFIRGATGLKTVRGHGCGYRGSKSSKIISTLLAHHFRTLEELEFSDFNIISGSDMQAILASCMNLKRFWITSRDEYDHELGIRYQDIVDHEWACLGVQELSLSLDRTVYTKMGIAAIRKDLQASRARESLEEDTREELDEQESDLDQLGDEEQQRQMNSLAAKLVYTQIGRLSMLETLALGITRRLYRYSGMDDDFDWSVYDDLDQSIDDDLDRSISDDLYRSIGDDLDRSIGDDLGRSIGDDLGRSIGDDLDQSIGDDLDRSIGDDLNQSIGDDPDWIVRQVWDLTLSKGWLAELSGLKKLRHLHMRADFWSRMGQEEVEFMDAEWPVLGDISFDMEKRKFPKLMEQPHWRWLHQKRPSLCLRVLRL